MSASVNWTRTSYVEIRCSFPPHVTLHAHILGETLPGITARQTKTYEPSVSTPLFTAVTATPTEFTSGISPLESNIHSMKGGGGTGQLSIALPIAG